MKELTKEMLLQAGIRISIKEDGTYLIERYGKPKRNGKLAYRPLQPTLNGKYHPVSKKTKYYYIIGWSQNGKPQAYPLARVIYAWFYGKVPANMDVDHINDDGLDNRLENLQLLTRRENLAKRKVRYSKAREELEEEFDMINFDALTDEQWVALYNMIIRQQIEEEN